MEVSNINIIGRMPEAEYRKMPGLAQSSLGYMDDSPRHFQLKEQGELVKTSAAMDLGTLLHMAVLEPTLFKENYLQEPHLFTDGTPINRRIAKHRDYLESWRLENVDKIIGTEKDFEKLTGMLKEMGRSPYLQELFSGGIPECVATWDMDGIPCKGRADYFVEHSKHGRLIIDLKKTVSAKASSFTRSVLNYKYHLQAAFYAKGFQADKYLIVAVEESFPHGIAVYDLDTWMNAGDALMIKLINRLKECRENDYWPSYTVGAELLQPPSWLPGALKEEEVEVSFGD